MKRILPRILPAAMLLASCSKQQAAPNPSNITPVDTISAGWTKTILSDSIPFFDIHFVNNTGFVMSLNSVYKSIDGGGNWTSVLKGNMQNNPFGNIAMGSTAHVSISVQPRQIVSSQDGGLTFDSTTFNDFSISHVFYVSAATAYAIGNSFWKTMDAGITWIKVYDFPDTYTGHYISMFFTDEQNGWTIRSTGAFHTSDGGMSWKSVSTNNLLNNNFTFGVYFIDAIHGFLSDFNSVIATSDGGEHWNKILSTDTATYHGMYFSTPDSGYVADGHRLLKTVDGGMHWTDEIVLTKSQLYEMYFADSRHGWVCGDKGVVLRYRN